MGVGAASSATRCLAGIDWLALTGLLYLACCTWLAVLGLLYLACCIWLALFTKVNTVLTRHRTLTWTISFSDSLMNFAHGFLFATAPFSVLFITPFTIMGRAPSQLVRLSSSSRSNSGPRLSAGPRLSPCLRLSSGPKPSAGNSCLAQSNDQPQRSTSSPRLWRRTLHA